MRYRVVEMHSDPATGTENQQPLREFDSAYAAVDFITTAWYRGDKRSVRLHLLDPLGRVLLRPDDMISARAADW
ncbi:MAG: hypothetical protein SFX73_12305 [Kofleriaceae bacterium]|nr:hypothetical protein [Kofleriaceae bacterium]